VFSLINLYTRKTFEEVEACSHTSVVSGLDGGKCFSAFSGLLSPEEERAVVTGRKHLWVKAVFWM